MNFGYFDDKKREYVITRPDTPAPWANYLGSPEYGALISNNAGGYRVVPLYFIICPFRPSTEPNRMVFLPHAQGSVYW